MLRMADIDAYPVLIDTGPLKDAEYPLPYFNHAITAVRRKSGEYIFMDSTNETTKELFPAYLCHRSIIIGTPEGEDLRISPITPAEKNMMEIRNSRKFPVLGGYMIHVTSRQICPLRIMETFRFRRSRILGLT